MFVNDTKIVSGDMRRGFTIIELLIVIVVIAILAAITILAYNGIAQKAHVTALQSDLSNGATALGTARAQATNGSYPADLASAGVKSSPGNALTYNVSGDGTSYCLQGQGYGVTYFVTSDNNVPQVGSCNGTIGVPANAQTPPPLAGNVTVSTFVGNGNNGYQPGTGTGAELDYPMGLVFDSSGNLYVADNGRFHNNCLIWKITSLAVATNFAGTPGTCTTTKDGTGSAAEFGQLKDLVISSNETLYASTCDTADSNNSYIRSISSSGVVTTLNLSWPSGSSGTSTDDQCITGLSMDSSGNIYGIMEDGGGGIVKLSAPSGGNSTVTILAGANGTGLVNGSGSTAKFNYPGDLAVSPDGTALYIADSKNQVIRKFDLSTGQVSTYAGNGTAGVVGGSLASAEFSYPIGITFGPDGNLYIADYGDGSSSPGTGNVIQAIDPTTGQVSTIAGTGAAWLGDVAPTTTGANAEFYELQNVAFGPDGNLYATDSLPALVRKITMP